MKMHGMKKVANNIIARGEVSGHSHIAVGDVEVFENEEGEIILDVTGEAAIKHLLEDAFVNQGTEVWTGEHADIKLAPGRYKYIPQLEYDPYNEAIRKVQD